MSTEVVDNQLTVTENVSGADQHSGVARPNKHVEIRRTEMSEEMQAHAEDVAHVALQEFKKE